MSKVEEVARAIYEGRNGHGCKAWSRLPKAHQEPYLSDARAAIKAMREPTPEMIEAAWRTTHSIPADDRMRVLLMDSRTAHSVKMLNRWRASIDAALSEEGR